MAIRRVIHWERSYLVQNIELRQVLLLKSHIDKFLARLRVQILESHLVQYLELR